MRKIRVKTLSLLVSEGFVYRCLHHELAVIVSNKKGSYAVVKLDSFGKEYFIDDEADTLSNMNIEEFKELLTE